MLPALERAGASSRLLRCGAALALILASLIAGPVAAGAQAGRPGARSAVASSPGGARALGPVSSARPIRLARGGSRPAALHTINTPPRASSRPTAPLAAMPQTSSPPGPQALQSFAGTSLNSQVAAFGSDQGVAPPDPSVAVGGSWVVEVTNESIFVKQRSGSAYPDQPGATCPPPGPGSPSYVPVSLGGCNEIDLNNFINSNGWTLSDPRILYDPAPGQFYLSFFIVTTPSPQNACLTGYQPGQTCSIVFVLHTLNGDPRQEWAGYYFDSYYSDDITDQPTIGYSDDKVGVAWDEYDASSTSWLGDEYLVMSKSVFLAGTSDPIIDPPSTQLAAPNTSYFSIFPVSNPAGGSTLYFVANNASSDLPSSGLPGPSLFILGVTGTSPSTIDQTYSFPPIAPSSSPPAATQEGSSETIDTDDDRINEGVWSNGVLWTGFNEACSGAATACIRYDEVSLSTSGSPPSTSSSVLHDLNFGIASSFVYYPSFGIDSSGDLLSTFTESSSTAYPSVMAVGIPVGQSQLSSPVPVVSGTGPFYDSSTTDGICSLPNGNGTSTACRFGDFATGAMDPDHPADMWFANEVQLDASSHTDWGTQLGRITYGLPSITSFSPSSGPTTGGVTVTVSGSDFGAGTALTFGGTATGIAALTPDSFTFVPPGSAGTPHAAGPVSGTVSDAAGGPSNAVSYTYLPPSRYHPLTPYRVCDTRTGVGYTDQCNASGPAPLGPGGEITVQVGGYTPPTFSGTIVPATATAAVLNLTSVNGSALTYLSVFPAGAAVPNAASVNANAHQNIGNLVTVPLGTGGAIQVYNSQGTVDVVIDVQGYYDAASGGADGLYHPLADPLRVCDSRLSTTACTAGPLTANSYQAVPVWGGSGGIPTSGIAEAAVLNLTGVSGSALTYLTVYPTTSSHICGPPPSTSSLNLDANVNQANRVVVPIDSTDGEVCVYNNQGTINFILDVNGWYGDGSDTGGAAFYPISPTRICDTRPSYGTECAGTTLGPQGTDVVPIQGVGPLPASGLKGLVANVTAVYGTAATFLTVWPDGTARTTSDINANPSSSIGNLDIVAIPADGSIDVYNSVGSIDVTVDALGWYA
jgi:hypothetical protein